MRNLRKVGVDLFQPLKDSHRNRLLPTFTFKREPYKTEKKQRLLGNLTYVRIDVCRNIELNVQNLRLKYFCRERTTTRLKTIWDERYRKTRPFVVDELHLEVGGKRPRISFSTVTGNASKKPSPLSSRHRRPVTRSFLYCKGRCKKTRKTENWNNLSPFPAKENRSQRLLESCPGACEANTRKVRVNVVRA